MSKFPDPVKPKTQTKRVRTERNREILFSAKVGIFLRMLIVGTELFAVAFYGSSSLFMDAISSLFDIVSTLFLILLIKLAERPPDTNHPFGHGRFEPLGGLQLGVLLVLIAFGILFQQSTEVVVPNEAPINSNLWFIPFFAWISLELCYRYIVYIARKNHSTALETEAYHFRIDSLTSLLATAALIFAAYFPQWSHIFDHIGGICIAIFMMVVGVLAVRSNLNQLMDRVPDSTFFTKVKQAALAVPGVLGTEKIRIQHYGPDAHVDIDIEVDPKLEVEEAHKISQLVRAEIQTAWPAVLDVTVHVEPFYENDH